MKQRIGIVALLAAGAVAGPIVSDAHAQSRFQIVAQSTLNGPNTYLNQWAPAGGLNVTAGGTVTFVNPTVLPHTVFFGDQPGRGLPWARARRSPRRPRPDR